MVKHIVMWRLADEAHGNSAEKNARFVKEKLEALAGRISGLLAIEVGLDFSRINSSGDVVLVSEFSDKAVVGASSERSVVAYEC